MKNNRLYKFMACLCLGIMTFHSVIQAQQLAFPEAQGWGRFATGGRTGSVYHVTNLNDSGAGSLRDAVSQPNRIIVFDVAGVIQLQSRLVFSKNLYIAGQTAPGEGIIVYGDAVSFSGASNSIVRYMKFRMGKGGTSGKDALGIANGTNMIFDHCSVSWGLDETFSISWDNKGTAPADITISNCIIGQGLLTHSAGGLIQADRITLYRNFYCDNDTRNNKIKGINQYVNCLVYNWKSGCYLMGGDSEGTSYVNATNNLFINGPAGGGNAMTGANSKYHIYAEDNWQDRNADGKFDPYEIPRNEYSGGPTFMSKPYDYPELPVWQATQLIDSLLPEVGASLPYRDLADHYMIHQVRSFGTKGGIISSESQLPFGAPTNWGTKTFGKRADTDKDGMPDEWESANGLNPNANDAMTIASNGYANIENYINSLTIKNRTPFLRTPVLFAYQSSTDKSITLEWFDFTDSEEGFILEVQTDGSWNEYARIPADTEKFTMTELTEGSSYKVRIRAYKGDELFSDYSNELTVKTQPKQVEMVDVDNYKADLSWGLPEGVWNYTDANWNGKLYADNTKVLFNPAEDANVTLDNSVSPATVVVNSPANVSITGTGMISGETSVNKAGSGTLTINTSNTYTGATVLHNGTLSFNTLKNGEVASALGASSEFGQNWIWDGGTWNYTGGTTSTNRSANLYSDTQFNVSNSSATVTMDGSINGTGTVTFGGKGTIKPSSPDFFNYDGATIVSGGTLHLPYLSSIEDKILTLGNSSKLILAGGKLSTKDANDNYTTYTFPIEAKEGTTSTFEPYRNCYIKSPFYGSGTIDFRISWVREYIQGDMTNFYGRLIGNGVGSSNQLVIDTKKGIPNGVVELKGTIMMIYWQTNGDIQIGGLKGTSSTTLGGSSKQTAGHKMTWRIGGANTNENFSGIINDCASNTADKYKGKTNIVKEGSGDWRLLGKNIYTGTTIVEGGRLIVNGTHTGGGAYTVKDGATLMGRGSIGSRVTIQDGGTLHIGDTLINSTYTMKLNSGLTINNGGQMEVPISYNGTKVTCNRVAVTGNSVISGATLIMNMDKAAGIPDGTELTVFSKIGTVTGSGFTTILPEQPSSTQVWDTSTLLTDGKIRILNKEEYTAIKGIHAEEEKDEQLYDLNGRPVSSDYKGIIIKGKNKILNK